MTYTKLSRSSLKDTSNSYNFYLNLEIVPKIWIEILLILMNYFHQWNVMYPKCWVKIGSEAPYDAAQGNLSLKKYFHGLFIDCVIDLGSLAKYSSKYRAMKYL